MKMIRYLAAIWLALFALPVAAQKFPAHGDSPVVDQANILSPAQKLDLDSKLRANYAKTGFALVVATVNSLEGYSIEDYGYRLGRYWQLSDKGKDNGVVLLVAPKERRVTIQTGYGADDYLTDAVSGIIIREQIIPKFKAGDMGAGIVAGTDALIARLQLPPEEAKQQAAAVAAKERKKADDVNPIPVVFIVVIFFVVIGSIARRAGGKRYRRRNGISPWVVLWGLNELSRGSRGGNWGGSSGWGGGGGFGGGGGGGFGGFGGGGSFGGGGASGSW